MIKHRSNVSNSLLQVIAALLLLALLSPLAAGEGEENVSEFTRDFLGVYNFSADKLVSLAEEIPADKYSWRPAEGVRSVKEAVLHVAGANYFFASLLGTDIPEGVNPRGLEKSVESKEDAIAALKTSYDHARAAVKAVSPENFNQEIDFFGNKVTLRQVIMILGNHAEEHLGQMIAYARSNGVVPPWSQKSE